MKVSLGTIDASDQERRGLRVRIGDPGLATRQEIREFALDAVASALERLLFEEGDWEGQREAGVWRDGVFFREGHDDDDDDDDDDGELY